MCERARRLDGLPGMPAVKWDQPEAFFDRLAKLKKRLPVHQGECYVEGHRGTYTTHGALKTAFRELERTLQLSEAVACVTEKNWSRSHVWKRMIFAQFHDYIPGSSVWDVYAEGIPELQTLAQTELTKAAGVLNRAAGEASLFNPHGVAVTTWIKPAGAKKSVRVRLPALSGTSVKAAQIDDGAPVTIKGLHASNGLSEFQLDKNGWIKSLRLDGRDAALVGPAGQLIFYTDKPARFESWDLDRHSLAMGKVCDAKAEITPFTDGPRAGFRVTRTVGQHSSATVEFALEAGSPLLHVSMDIDWRDEHALLKFFVPTQHLAPQARFGIPYGSVLRPQLAIGPHSEAMWEVPFSRWLAVFDEQERDGLFLVTEAKYGATVRDGAIGLSLVRSPRQVGYDNHRGAWPPALSRIQAPSQHTDIGTHKIRLAIGRYHAGLTRAEHPASRADTLFTGPFAYRGASHASPIQSLEGGETLIPAWAQPIGNSNSTWLLRLHEVAGQRRHVLVKPAAGWTVARSDSCGNPLKKTAADLRVEFTPHQIVSLVFQQTPSRENKS